VLEVTVTEAMSPITEETLMLLLEVGKSSVAIKSGETKVMLVVGLDQ
jgi:hypothetical protein